MEAVEFCLTIVMFIELNVIISLKSLQNGFVIFVVYFIET